ncbi:MAG TPA: MMPL family transporter [Thermomicrobiales bacterium]|nr:MMPL family transporter [Thermomicrobiales bacterium]
MVVLSGSLPSPLTSEDDFTNTPEAVKGSDLIEQRLHGKEPLTETVIISSETQTVDDPAFQQVVIDTTSALRGMPDVVKSAGNYYEALDAGEPAAGQLVSDDRMSTIIPVTLLGEYDDVSDYGTDYVAMIEAQGADGIDVYSVGTLSGGEIYGKIAEEDLGSAEMFGLPIALLILVVVFGALVAAGVPLVVALSSIAVAMGISTIIGQIHPLSDIVMNIIVMIGLAVGIDYALFIVERYREERRHGAAKHDAIAIAGGTATKAVVFSGMTVVIALAGMFILPISVFRSLGIGAMIAVVVSVAASMTMIPALLALLGDKIDWPRRRKYDTLTAEQIAANRFHDDSIHGGFWGRITKTVMARPVISAVLAIGILVAAALPYLDLKTGQTGIESLPESEVKSGYEILSEKFYAGILSPTEIVIDGNANSAEVQQGIDALVTALGNDPQYGPTAIEVNEAGDLTLVSVPMTIDSSTPEAEQKIDDLRDTTIPNAFASADAEVYVTGDAAFNRDFNLTMRTWTPIVFAFVLGLSFILLMLAFRSIIVPIKAIIMNLLSVGAAYGLLTLVFQKGIGNEIFGFSQTPVIATWIPIFLFCILFGLSMDYHVFLLSRIREHYDSTHNNRESVAVGLQSTAKIITGAALIMVAVFSAFAAGRLVEMQQMGFGLAVAVFLDATIVRSVLVPSTMALLGDRNWYLPRWLSWLPDLRVEGQARAQAPVAATAGDD